MSPAPLSWIYHEFGLASLHDTGRDAWLIIGARTSRMFAYGANSVFIALFFSALGFSDVQIGLFMTLTLAGDVVLTLILTLIADSLGRRRTLLLGSIMMVVSGSTFVLCDNYWVLLVAAVIGVISASGGDFGPFRAIEESILSHLTANEQRMRNDVLAWYVTSASLGSAIGTEGAGRIIAALQSLAGWTEVRAYHALFSLYVIMGLVNVGCVLSLSKRTEADRPEEKEDVLLKHVDGTASPILDSTPIADSPNGSSSTHGVIPSPPRRRSPLSASTQAVMFKLWPLLAVDSMADGMVNYSLTSYYLDHKFGISATTLGDVTSISYFLAAISTIFAGPLANRLGLVNTMVFTHVPSSAAVLFFPLPSQLWLTIVLLFIRTGLNNMDQAPRAAFIARAVPPNERTAVNGVTSTLRTLAATVGPTITGGLAESDWFGVAFVLAGCLRLAYDFGLWKLFIGMDGQQDAKDEREEALDAV